MKKIFSIVLLFSCFLLVKCSDVEIKENTVNTSTTPSVKQPSKKSSNIGGREIILGQLNWDSGRQLYLSNFSANSDLTITKTLSFVGPYPIPTNLTPVFHLAGCADPAVSVYDQSPNGEINTFAIDYVVNPATGAYSTDISVLTLKNVSGYYQVDPGTISDASAGPIHFDGKVVYVNGAYYAVATSYQVPSQAPVVITTPSNAGFTISKQSKGRALLNYNINLYYSNDQGNSWHVINPSAYIQGTGSYLQFKADISPQSTITTLASIIFTYPNGATIGLTVEPGTQAGQILHIDPTPLAYFSQDGSVTFEYSTTIFY